MRPRFLLDEQISPKVAARARAAGVDVTAVAGSSLAGFDDAEVFREAIASGCIVVTYDIPGFMPLLIDAVKAGHRIPGVVFVTVASIPASDFGALAAALAGLARRIERGEVDPSAGVFLGVLG